jgi:hypothetical protein
MPIRPYLAGRAVTPETLAVMNAAFEDACKTLNLAAEHPVRAMVAQIVIYLVQEGKTEARQIASEVVKEMRRS